MKVNIKEFRSPTDKPVKVFSEDFIHSAIIENTWGPLREECWKAAYSEGCVSKDMAVKGLDVDQTLAAIKQEEKNFEDQVLESMAKIIELGNPEDLDNAGRPKVEIIGNTTGRIPSATLRNKLYKKLVGE